jgi:hypothetical protein
MTTTSLLAAIAGALFLLFGLYTATRGDTAIKNVWLFPAALSLLFLLFSLEVIVTEGLLGFWTEHTRNLWGNQIWFDLLLAVGIGWFVVVPQAKALGMRPLPWFLLVAATGSVGFLAMIARLLYLRERSGQRSYYPRGVPDSSL